MRHLSPRTGFDGVNAPAANDSVYSRENPSPRYRELVGMYRKMHREGIPELGMKPSNVFAGASLVPHLPVIKQLVAQHGATSLLDYGAGKGSLYRMGKIKLRTGETIANVASYLGVKRIVCYDPGVDEHCSLPSEQFDGVISTDVLEHCPEQDLPWIIEEMFARARKFIFANIACYPAAKKLPNGENAHCTIRPPAWWQAITTPIGAHYPAVTTKFQISTAYDR